MARPTAAPFTFHIWPGNLLCDEADAVFDTVRDVFAETAFSPHASVATSVGEHVIGDERNPVAKAVAFVLSAARCGPASSTDSCANATARVSGSPSMMALRNCPNCHRHRAAC
ncbi:hypothetical protein [Mycobacterium sp. TY813]|uniref:hypothetical protein n=1 Tax=Mycobacterium TaxID=1763 RepID=UPI0027418D00|nr:hypothetical protein [Mycobacterium sp. TY813]MDP7733000.1 hypothetical protein [Mycobacterium sp. TY813]